MNAERLLEHYDRIADAPEAIPRLRRFILDLAVRGKLVPQDPKDEPGSELLKRIAKEKARLVKTGDARKSEVDPVDLNDAPFLVPCNWAWTRLGSVGDWGSGSTPPRGNFDLYGGGITWLKSGELNDNRQLAGSDETVTELAVAKGSFRLNQPGDVLIAMYGATIGKVAILAEKAFTNQAVCGCTPFAGVFNHFLFLFLLSQREQFHSASEGGAQPNISKVKIIWTPFPLPPLAEQHRIVAKVDELMALCDRQEAARAEREAARDRLSAVSLARLNAPDPATFQDDVRFALDTLQALSTRPNQIKDLRQTILNLAVRGKLVPQDPNDEPASKLLKRMAVVRLRRIKGGSAKKNERLIPIEMNDIPYQLPQAWRWVSLCSIAKFENGDRSGNYPSGSEIKAEGVPFISTKNISNHEVDLTTLDFISPEKFESLRSGKIADLDILITLRGSVGKFGLFRATEKYKTGFINAQLLIVRNYDPAVVEYCLNFFESEAFEKQVSAKSSGSATPQLSAGQLADILVPVPPLAEQHRIVAKVDAMMALCDRLEASLDAVATTRRRLLDALLAEALAPTIQRDAA